MPGESVQHYSGSNDCCCSIPAYTHASGASAPTIGSPACCQGLVQPHPPNDFNEANCEQRQSNACCGPHACAGAVAGGRTTQPHDNLSLCHSIHNSIVPCLQPSRAKRYAYQEPQKSSFVGMICSAAIKSQPLHIAAGETSPAPTTSQNFKNFSYVWHPRGHAGRAEFAAGNRAMMCCNSPPPWSTG